MTTTYYDKTPAKFFVPEELKDYFLYNSFCELVDLVRQPIEIDYLEDVPSILEELLPNYGDKEAVLAYYNVGIRPRLGTNYAMKNVLKLLNIDAKITEWFDAEFLLPSFKFMLDFDEPPEGLDVDKLIKVIYEVKNERSWLAAIRQVEDFKTILYLDDGELDNHLLEDVSGINYNGVNIFLTQKYTSHFSYFEPVISGMRTLNIFKYDKLVYADWVLDGSIRLDDDYIYKSVSLVKSILISKYIDFSDIYSISKAESFLFLGDFVLDESLLDDGDGFNFPCMEQIEDNRLDYMFLDEPLYKEKLCFLSFKDIKSNFNSEIEFEVSAFKTIHLSSHSKDECSNVLDYMELDCDNLSLQAASLRTLLRSYRIDIDLEQKEPLPKITCNSFLIDDNFNLDENLLEVGCNYADESSISAYYNSITPAKQLSNMSVSVFDMYQFILDESLIDSTKTLDANSVLDLYSISPVTGKKLKDNLDDGYVLDEMIQGWHFKNTDFIEQGTSFISNIVEPEISTRKTIYLGASQTLQNDLILDNTVLDYLDNIQLFSSSSMLHRIFTVDYEIDLDREFYEPEISHGDNIGLDTGFELDNTRIDNPYYLGTEQELIKYYQDKLVQKAKISSSAFFMDMYQFILDESTLDEDVVLDSNSLLDLYYCNYTNNERLEPNLDDGYVLDEMTQSFFYKDPSVTHISNHFDSTIPFESSQLKTRHVTQNADLQHFEIAEIVTRIGSSSITMPRHSYGQSIGDTRDYVVKISSKRTILPI